MLQVIENDFLKISSSTHGGELHSIKSKKSNTEYLWNGNPDFWKYHAPILFPIVGKVKDGKYKVDGKTYELPQHGLARVRDFSLKTCEDNKVTYELIYSEDTLKVYPYKFSLCISYELIDNNLKVSYKVTNLDDKTIYFSIGAHPGFMCPLKDNESLNDYYFEFNKKETADLMTLDMSVGLISHNTIPYLNNENIIPLHKELFKNDALIFKNLDSNLISIKSKNHNQSLSMDFTGFPYMGLWAMPTGCPFVCIEPWFGHADFVDFNGELKDKAGIQSLEIGEEFNCSYNIIVTE